MQYLKADTTKIVRIGPAVVVGDGFTTTAALDISTADYAYMLHGDSVEVDISANTWAATTSVTGTYDLTLLNTQLTTEGPMSVVIQDVSLCLPIRHDFHVLNANVYDSLFGPATTDYLQVDTIQAAGTAWASGAITAAALGADCITAAKIADDALVAANFATGAFTADAFAADAIVAATLATGALTADAFAADALIAATFATDSIAADALAADALAEIKAQVVAALDTDTYVESAGVPAATASIQDKIAWLASLARNKITQTGTTQTLRDDADGASIATAAVSDDGTTTTRAEWA